MAVGELLRLLPVGAAWVVAAGVVSAALRLRQKLTRAGNRLRVGLRGVVKVGDGAFSALAFHRVEQVGRAVQGKKGTPTIVFEDLAFDSEIAGGKVALESGGEIQVRGGRRDDEVWVDLEARQPAVEPGAFAAAYTHARKTKGFSRTVESRLLEGDPVVVAGVEVDGVLQGEEGQPLLVATPAAVAWCVRQVIRLTWVVGAALAVSSLLTLANLTRVEGLLGSELLYSADLLLILGVAAAGWREIRRSTPLPVAPLRGTWRRGDAP